MLPTNSGSGSEACSPISLSKPAPPIRSASAVSCIFSTTAPDSRPGWTTATPRIARLTRDAAQALVDAALTQHRQVPEVDEDSA